MENKAQPEAGLPDTQVGQPDRSLSSDSPQNGRFSAHSFANRGIALFSGSGARAGYLAAVDQAVISLANFLATLILARNVSPTELGIYGVGFTALRLVRAVQEGLTIQPLNTFGPGMEPEQFRRYASATTLIQVGLALVFSAAAAAGGYILTVFGNDGSCRSIFAGCCMPAARFSWQ
jgi:hypothetical protein